MATCVTYKESPAWMYFIFGVYLIFIKTTGAGSQAAKAYPNYFVCMRCGLCLIEILISNTAMEPSPESLNKIQAAVADLR